MGINKNPQFMLHLYTHLTYTAKLWEGAIMVPILQLVNRPREVKPLVKEHTATGGREVWEAALFPLLPAWPAFLPSLPTWPSVPTALACGSCCGLV
jgi:hypothetical protein